MCGECVPDKELAIDDVRITFPMYLRVAILRVVCKEGGTADMRM